MGRLAVCRVCGFYTGKFDKTIDASLSRCITTTGIQHNNNDNSNAHNIVRLKNATIQVQYIIISFESPGGGGKGHS